jgi:hypothetical protein
MNAEPVKHGVTDIRRAARLSVAPMMDGADQAPSGLFLPYY